MNMSALPLGRRTPGDFQHVEKYPLEATPEKPTPVVLGINWYSGFDDPKQDDKGRYWLPSGHLGYVRGGHCICVKAKQPDAGAWWEFYNQGSEGACVGFGCSRAMSLLNRVEYDAPWLYHEAQLIDEWDDTPPEEGTSVRAGLEVLRTQGARRAKSGVVAAGDGIAAYRWATSVDQVHAAIQLPVADQLEAVPLLNSWGDDYPHLVWLPDATLDRLLSEQGEAGLITDK